MTAHSPTDIARFRVVVSDPTNGATGISTFRDMVASMSFVRRIAARSPESPTGYRVIDTHTGQTIREGVL